MKEGPEKRVLPIMLATADWLHLLGCHCLVASYLGLGLGENVTQDHVEDPASASEPTWNNVVSALSAVLNFSVMKLSAKHETYDS